HQRSRCRGAAHDGVTRRGPGKDKSWIIGFAAHGVVSRAERAADDDCDLGDYRVGNRIDHLGPGTDNAAPFRVAAHHEAVAVVQKDEGNQVLVRIHDEARRFFRRFGVDHAAEFDALFALVADGLLMHFLIGYNADGEATDAGIATKYGLAIFGFVFV